MKNKIFKIFIQFSPVIFGIISFFVFFFGFKNLTISDDDLNLLVTISFTLFGFALTSFSIIVNLTSHNDVFKKVMRKGHFIPVIVSICLMGIVSILMLIFKFNNLNASLSYFCFSTNIFSLIVLIYIIIVLGIQNIKTIEKN